MIDLPITSNADYTEKSKVARSDHVAAYQQFAKMAAPKHVENFIQDEEEFGEAQTQTLASMGKS